MFLILWLIADTVTHHVKATHGSSLGWRVDSLNKRCPFIWPFFSFEIQLRLTVTETTVKSQIPKTTKVGTGSV